MARLLLTVALWSAAADARADVTVEVPEGAVELAAALALELGPDARVVCRGEGRDVPIDARVAVHRAEDSTEVEVQHRALATPLRSATARHADPRTLAIVAAELIVEADERFLDALPTPEATPAPRPTRPAANTERPPRRMPYRPAVAPPDGSGLVLQGGFGGLTALNRDVARGGGQLRLVLGHRFDARYRLVALVELGALTDPVADGAHLQPFGRGCIEGAIGAPAEPVGVHVAMHACVLGGVRRRQESLSTIDASGYEAGHGWYAEVGWGSFSFGGAVAVGGSLVDDLHLWVRADVDGSLLGAEGVVLGALSVMLGTP